MAHLLLSPLLSWGTYSCARKRQNGDLSWLSRAAWRLLLLRRAIIRAIRTATQFCTVIRTVTAHGSHNGMVDATDASPHPGRLRTLQSGAVSVVCDALRKFPECAELQEEGLCALSHCCLPPYRELHCEVSAQGGIAYQATSVIKSFQSGDHGSPMILLRCACSLILNLTNLQKEPLEDSSFSPSVTDQIFESKLMDALIRVAPVLQKKSALLPAAGLIFSLQQHTYSNCLRCIRTGNLHPYL